MHSNPVYMHLNERRRVARSMINFCLLATYNSRKVKFYYFKIYLPCKIIIEYNDIISFTWARVYVF